MQIERVHGEKAADREPVCTERRALVFEHFLSFVKSFIRYKIPEEKCTGKSNTDHVR